MSESQIFQLLGLVYALVGLGWLINPSSYRRVMDEYAHDRALTYLSGILATVAGYVIVAFRDRWDSEAGIIITIIGWLALLKGVWMLLLPDYFEAITKKFLAIKTAWASLVLILGVVFLYISYTL